MHLSFTLTLFAAGCLADDFSNFAAKNGKSYKDVKEFKKRKLNWEKHHSEVEELNLKNRERGVKFADNFTSDMDDAEFM